MLNINKIYLLSVLCPLLLTGCSSGGDCRQTSSVSLGVEFYRAYFDAVQEQYVSESLTDTMTVFGLGSDSLLYNENPSSGIRLPLKKLSGQTAFIFERKSQQPDTVNFIHENENSFISLECGSMIMHRITGIEHTFYGIDSVSIINSMAADGLAENIRIYFK